MLKIIKRYSLAGILLLALVLRLYRINDLLGFWYDQGRDALVIWDLIHKGKVFLIGPMMANSGVFRGPWYYWLITPFYWLGQGNPLWPTVFLILTSVGAIFAVYELGGLKPALIATISMYIVGASRWLADPTPTLLVSVLLVWAAFKFLEKRAWAMPLIGFLVGMALNFSAATEAFYIPALLLIFYLKRKNLPNLKMILLPAGLFLLAFVPQMLFEIRHPGVQTGAFYQFVFKQNSFTLSFWQTLRVRLPFYYNLIASKFWLNGGLIFAPFFILFVITLFTKWKSFWKDDKFKILFILSVAPIIGTLFFTGSEGNIYEYYFTGYYLIWILLFAKVVTSKFVFSLFIAISLIMNFIAFRQESNIIKLADQIKAVDWVYQDSNGKPFNLDVYVPPVIPYAYQYLFLWRSKGNLVDAEVPLLYTLEEPDPDHPDRISVWMNRQDRIGKVENTATFSLITVQKRERFSLNEK